ncbi:MAG: hypothetical protein FWG99_03750 [Treponema sp.]|nr:hypothetical protein [Treponema sp.]
MKFPLRLAVIFTALVLLWTGCPMGDGGDEFSVIFESLSADGWADTFTTTMLTLSFNKPINGLTASDIDFNAGSTGAVKGALTGSGKNYELALGDIYQSGEVSVSVTKSRYSISGNQKIVWVHYWIDPSLIQVYFGDIIANGWEEQTTTIINLYFDREIEGLNVSDIIITDTDSTGITKGTLTHIGDGHYELTVSGITESGQITVEVTKSGYHIWNNKKQTQVYNSEPVEVFFSNLMANGWHFETTTILTLYFSMDIEGLSNADITFDGGSTGASIGTISKIWNGAYEVPINEIGESGTVSMSVSKEGYIITGNPQEAWVYLGPGDAEFSISFGQISDVVPVIDTDVILYRESKGEPTTATVTVENPGQYDSISWRVQDTDVTGTGASFTLSAANSAYNYIGKHFLTISVWIDGVPYNKTVSFRVEY